eukprot:1157087-Pelagomonas_calceolata.AAC.1
MACICCMTSSAQAVTTCPLLLVSKHRAPARSTHRLNMALGFVSIASETTTGSAAAHTVWYRTCSTPCSSAPPFEAASCAPDAGPPTRLASKSRRTTHNPTSPPWPSAPLALSTAQWSRCVAPAALALLLEPCCRHKAHHILSWGDMFEL